ncbi:MAG TPA: metal-dependent transcriptional regulator [Melioribacteraceae bacterium]|nr:metal-dependent transcriptional regulator [Melioribacteraceae bacterium]
MSLGVWIIHPKYGLLNVWKKYKKNTDRVLLEDSLKHLFDSDYRGLKSTIQTLASYLNISLDKAKGVISGLEKTNLVNTDDDELNLTTEGKTQAYRMVRMHRVFERYLSEKSGLKEYEWHQEAEHAEHNLTFEQINKIAAEIGNPLFDPHGDPIPSAEGVMPKHQGISLGTLLIGETGIITHIEDEPIEVFAQITALGIFPGSQLTIIEKDNVKIKFLIDGQEIILAPVLAQNISVVVNNSIVKKKKYKTLSMLKDGEEAYIAGISQALRGMQRRRLMDFGIVIGTKIRAELESLNGDPKGYFVRGTTVALRNKQAENIFIQDKPIGDNND